MAGRVAKPKREGSKQKPKSSLYAVKLDKLEAQLASTSDAEALVAIGIEFHSVGYSLGRDISSIIDNPGLVDRATMGQVVANERASEVYERTGDICAALSRLFVGLDAFPTPTDRERLTVRIAGLLDTHSPVEATRLRAELAALPVIDDEAAARQQFYNVVWRIKNTVNWEQLPRSS